MIACLKDGMSKLPQHTLKDGLTNQKLRLTLLEQAISMISQKATKCWVTLGTVTIAFVQPVTGCLQIEFGQLSKANPYSERWLRLLQNIRNSWGVTTRENVNGWVVKQLIIWHEVKLEGSIWSTIPCLESSIKTATSKCFLMLCTGWTRV
jgi:hypothetical protein